MKFRKLIPTATTPSYANPGDAGLDLYAAEATQVWPGQRCAIRTGIAVEIPVGYEGQVRGRSGLAFNRGVFAHVGTIDSSYRGELKCLLFNTGAGLFSVAVGDRVGQLVVSPCLHVALVEVEALSDTARGEGGLGSTGR